MVDDGRKRVTCNSEDIIIWIELLCHKYCDEFVLPLLGIAILEIADGH